MRETRCKHVRFGISTLLSVSCLVMWLLSGTAFAQNNCMMPLGDVTGNGETNVTDVQCSIILSLATLQSEDLSSVTCLNVAPEYADVDCSGSTAVSDVMLTILSALEEPLNPALDTDGSGCPDACEQEPFCMNCETDWSLISDSLLTKLELLPSPPATPLEVEWPEHGAQVRWDTVEASDIPQGWGPEDGCTSGLWDSARVTAGSPYINEDGEERCWASVGNGNFNEGKDKDRFYFRNRRGGNSSAIVGDPAWVQARFPMAPGHDVFRLDIEVKTPRLFGFPPDLCMDTWTQEDGSCNYNLEEPWDDTDRGIYVLFSTPGATSYHITGPHLPSPAPPPWGDITLSPEVPAALLGTSELVVTVFMYRQYPKECWFVVDEDTGEESKTCTDGYGGNNMSLKAIKLETRASSLAGDGPPLERPRIFGTDDVWLADQEALNNMPCITIEQTTNVVGDLENIKNLWDQYTLGAVPCEDEVVPPLSEHPYIAPYLDDIQFLKDEGDWDPEPLEALHAIRRTKACLAGPEPDTCQATAEEMATIIEAFKTEELASIDDATWCATACTVGFDLQTGPLMFRWAIFADTLWDDLTPAEHVLLADKLGEKIDNFLNIGLIRHWALFNGNNWTPALVHGALAWAIAYYHEDPRAFDVAVLAVGAMWWHDHIWKSDGSYEEGMSYGGHDLALLAKVTRLYKKSFGVPHFTPWSYFEQSPAWFIDMMATDGWTIDFGDSHKTMGWGTAAPLWTALASEWVHETPATVDPCVARSYWSHKYWMHGFKTVWEFHPWMARDWQAIMDQCEEVSEGSEITIYPVGGWVAMRSVQPGSSGMTEGLPAHHKGLDADKTMLAASAVPNTFAHMEADFGSIIWSAFGSRFLSDLGYGSQAKDIYATEIEVGDNIYTMIDNGPMGHTTLYVPEATYIHDYTGRTMNSSHVKGGVGTATEGVWGDAAGVHLDGAFVYGKVDGNPAYAEAEAMGWLEHFDRWLIQLPGGHFLVADSFLKRADREDVTPAETWTFAHQPMENPEAACKYKDVHVEVSLVDESTVHLEPECSMLFYSLDTTAVGRILAASVTPGQFTEPVVYDNFKNNGGFVTHKLLRYEPTEPAAYDARVFALIAAPSMEAFPAAELSHLPCDNPADACFSLTLDGATTHIHFEWDGMRHVLSTVDLP